MKLDENLNKCFESNTGHSSKTRKDPYTVPPTNAELKDLIAKQFDVRIKFQTERESKDFVKSVALPLEGLPQELLSEARQNTESDLPAQEMQLNTTLAEVTCLASRVTLKHIPLQWTSTRSNLDDDAFPTTEEHTDSENEMDTAPQDDSNEAGPSTEKIIRRPPNPKWIEYEKKMLKLPKRNVTWIISSVNFSYCCKEASSPYKSNCELVQQLRLPSKDEETVLKFVRSTWTLNIHFVAFRRSVNFCIHLLLCFDHLKRKRGKRRTIAKKLTTS